MKREEGSGVAVVIGEGQGVRVVYAVDVIFDCLKNGVEIRRCWRRGSVEVCSEVRVLGLTLERIFVSACGDEELGVLRIRLRGGTDEHVEYEEEGGCDCIDTVAEALHNSIVVIGSYRFTGGTLEELRSSSKERSEDLRGCWFLQYGQSAKS